MLQNNPTLKSLIDKLWNQFWSGGISNPLTAIEQITYLLFMKRLDLLETEREIQARRTKKAYLSRFDGKFTIPGTRKVVVKSSLRWSNFSQMPADKMLYHVQDAVFPFLKALNGHTSPFTKHMANAVFIMPKPSLLKEAISIIEEIFIEIARDAKEGGHSFQDIQGDVYEVLLSAIASAGKNGQFRTPRHVIKLVAELTEPKLGMKIADPACGTAGFLLGAYQYILSKNIDKSNLYKDEDGFLRGMSIGIPTSFKQQIEDGLVGYDIDPTMVRLGLMNLMMHGIDNPNIDYADTLSKDFSEKEKYDLILANPPFTGNIDGNDISPEFEISTTKTELLFVERIFLMLKKGGNACIIVPSGVVSNSGKAFVSLRKKMVEECNLKAVISLPGGVFKPYAGVATSILLFEKGGETENVWFYNLESDGYSLDDRRIKLESNGDLQDVIKRYRSRHRATSEARKKHFLVLKEEVVKRDYDLGISTYIDDDDVEIDFESPGKILNRINKAEKEIAAKYKALNRIFK
jgi:type I restriction enzyme M protein